MKFELKKEDGKTVGYSLVPENKKEQYALNTIRNHHFFGIEETAICYDGMESSTEDGVELATRLNFIQSKYQSDPEAKRKIKVYPIVEENNPVDMLRKECFAVVRDEIKSSYDHNAMDVLMKLSLDHKKLPVASLVMETYLGIIGYRNWLKELERCPISFIGDALHDLSGCLQYNRNDGYSPRTHQYIEFYKS